MAAERGQIAGLIKQWLTFIPAWWFYLVSSSRLSLLRLRGCGFICAKHYFNGTFASQLDTGNLRFNREGVGVNWVIWSALWHRSSLPLLRTDSHSSSCNISETFTFYWGMCVQTPTKEGKVKANSSCQAIVCWTLLTPRATVTKDCGIKSVVSLLLPPDSWQYNPSLCV